MNISLHAPASGPAHIYREGPRRRSRSREDISFTAHLDDVWGMPAASPFGVKGMDGSALEGCDSIFDKAALATCTSMSSATERQQSMAPGVVPQSDHQITKEKVVVCSLPCLRRTAGNNPRPDRRDLVVGHGGPACWHTAEGCAGRPDVASKGCARF
jgi:hypothetical protein